MLILCIETYVVVMATLVCNFTLRSHSSSLNKFHHWYHLKVKYDIACVLLKTYIPWSEVMHPRPHLQEGWLEEENVEHKKRMSGVYWNLSRILERSNPSCDKNNLIEYSKRKKYQWWKMWEKKISYYMSYQCLKLICFEIIINIDRVIYQ